MSEQPISVGQVIEENLQLWAIVEVLGHNTFAGQVSTQAIGGANFVRVDVPGLPERRGQWGQVFPEQQPFTKFIGPGSIYAITPVSEEAAKQAAAQLRARPITVVDLSRPALPAPAVDDEDDEDEGEGEDEAQAQFELGGRYETQAAGRL